MLMYFLTNTQLHNLTTPIEMICTITTDLFGYLPTGRMDVQPSNNSPLLCIQYSFIPLGTTEPEVTLQNAHNGQHLCFTYSH